MKSTAISIAIHLVLAVFLLSFQTQVSSKFSVDAGMGAVEIQLTQSSAPAKKIKPPTSTVSAVIKPALAIAQETSYSEGTDSIAVSSGKGALTEIQPDYFRNPAPVYPERARILRQEGVVYIYVAIAQDGSVKDLSLGKTSGFPLLDEAALKAVRKWQFQPAQRGGTATESRVSIPIRFNISKA